MDQCNYGPAEPVCGCISDEFIMWPKMRLTVNVNYGSSAILNSLASYTDHTKNNHKFIVVLMKTNICNMLKPTVDSKQFLKIQTLIVIMSVHLHSGIQSYHVKITS